MPGVRVGHWSDARALTGCTVVLFDGEATAGVGRELARRGGVGTYAHRVGDVTIGALFVVNAVGDVVAEDGSLVGAPPGTRRIVDRLLAGERPVVRTAREATTIGVIATDALLSKTEASWVASVAQDGIARAVVPAHSRADGDTVFAASTLRGPRIDLETIGAVAVEVAAEAIRRAVR